MIEDHVFLNPDADAYGDPCKCCGSVMSCYCHEQPHFKPSCPGFYVVPYFDWLVCLKQWGFAVAWRPRHEQAIEFLVLCFVLTFYWRPPELEYDDA